MAPVHGCMVKQADIWERSDVREGLCAMPSRQLPAESVMLAPLPVLLSVRWARQAGAGPVAAGSCHPAALPAAQRRHSRLLRSRRRDPAAPASCAAADAPAAAPA